MKKKMLVVMSHQISKEQIDDFGGEVISLRDIDSPLQHACSNIPAKAQLGYIRELAEAIAQIAVREDCSHIAVMGEPTLVLHSVIMGDHNGLTALTSTTERVSVDEPQPDGSTIKKSIFKHVMWRRMLYD